MKAATCKWAQMCIHVYTFTHAQDATFLHADTTCVYLCIIATEDMGHRPQRPGVDTVIRACSPPTTGHRPPTYGKYPNGPPDVRRDCTNHFLLLSWSFSHPSLPFSLSLPPSLTPRLWACVPDVLHACTLWESKNFASQNFAYSMSIKSYAAW